MSTVYQRKRFEIHRSIALDGTAYYWRLVAANGRVLLTSPKYFPTKQRARMNIKSIRRTIALAGVVDREA